MGAGHGGCAFGSAGKINAEHIVVHSSATHAGQVKAINDYITGVIGSHANLVGFGTLHSGLETSIPSAAAYSSACVELSCA